MSNTISLKNSNPTTETQKGRINPNIAERASKLKEDYLKNDFVEISDFLTTDFAESCYNFYFRDMPRNWWQASSWPNIDNKDEIKYQYEHEDKSQTLKHCMEHFHKGDFCYFFHRTKDDHKDSCVCGECGLRNFFKSNEMITFLSFLSGERVSSASGHFSSWYRKGDFLSTHHDDGNGLIGVVLDFAKNWNPVFGGNLFILEDDWRTCKKAIVPKFNNLKVFNIPKEKKGVPHFVSNVLIDSDIREHSDKRRIAFGGWYK